MQLSKPERDWLPLGFLTLGAGAGLLTLAATVLIRLELQEPGVQYLVDASGRPDGLLYSTLHELHGAVTVLFVMLPMLFAALGYRFVPLSLSINRTRLRPLGWLGLVLLGTGLACLIYSVFAVGPKQDSISIGRFIYPWPGDDPRGKFDADWSVLLSVSLPFLSLFLVFVDFLVTSVTRLRTTSVRESIPAWAYVAAGAVLLAAFVANFIPSENGPLIVLGTLPFRSIDLALQVVSVVGLVSALWVSILQGGERWIVPFLWSVPFVVLLGYGKFTGYLLSQFGVDAALHNTYYEIGHAHSLNFSASVFALSAGIFSAFPSVGRQMGLSTVQVSLMVVATVLTVWPFVLLGLQGNA